MNTDSGNEKKILIAEDEKAYLRALTLKLKNSGFNVTGASDGEEALQLISQSQYDLFLCDLIMPKTNGFIVLETLKAQHIQTPVIILSNLSQMEDEKKARELGAVDFLIKSNTPIADVISKITQFLSKK